MKERIIEDALFPDCPIRNILARISDKWSLLILYTLEQSGEAPMRFKELQRAIPDISQKMLSVTLQNLQEDGYVVRTAYPEVPPRVEYSLTERAHSLLPHVHNLILWAQENMDAIKKDRAAKGLWYWPIYLSVGQIKNKPTCTCTAPARATHARQSFK